MLASIQPASVNQNRTDLGITADSEKRGNALRFDLTKASLPALISEAREMAARTAIAPITIGLNRVMGFANRKKPAIVLTCGQGRTELLMLYRALAAPCSGTASQTLEPHLTFLYDRKPFPQIVSIAPIHWTAHEFVLIYSHYGQSRHERLGKWPLRA